MIAVVGTVGGYFFTRSENRATLASAERRAQDETLQVYLDEMGQMLLDNETPLRQSQEDDEVRTLARARTLTVLSGLNGRRKGTVVQSLYESGLIGWIKSLKSMERYGAIVDLRGADLRGAVLGKFWYLIVETATDVVAEHYEAMVRVAVALCYQGTLSGSQVGEIVERAEGTERSAA